MATRKIQGITIEFGADATKYLKTISEIKSKQRDLNSVLKSANKLLKFDTTNFEILSQKQGNLKKQITESNNKLKEFKKLAEKLKASGISETSDEFQALRREIIYSENELQNLQEELKKTNDAIRFNHTPFGKLGTKLEQAGGKISNVGEKISGLADKAIKTGAIMTASLTLPLVKAGKVSLEAFTDFESALTGVAKTTELSGESLKEFGNQALELSRNLPYTASEILGVSEAAGQLGVSEKNLLKFSETMIRLGQSTNLSSEEAAIAIAQFANVTGMAEENVDRFGSTVVALGNTHATTEADIVNMATRLSGMSKVVNMSTTDTLALSASLAEMGITAELGGTNVSKIFQKINSSVIDNGAKLKIWAELAGQSAEQFAKDFRERPAEAFAKIIDGLEGFQKSGGNSIALLKDLGISAQREVDIFQRLQSNTDNLRNSMNMANGAWEENTALMKESNLRNQTTDSRMKILRNRITEVGVKLGEALVPVLEDLVPIIEKATTWFTNLDDTQKENIVRIGALVAVAGPLVTVFGTILKPIGFLTKGFGGLTSKLGSFVKNTASLKNATAPATSGLSGLGIAIKGVIKGGLAKTGPAIGSVGKALIGFAGNPITLAVAGIGALGYATYKHLSKEALPAVDLFADGVSEGTAQAVQSFLDLEKNTTNSLNQLKWSSQTITDEAVAGIKENIASMTNTVSEGLVKQKEQSLSTLTAMFENSKTLTEIEKQELLAKTEESYDQRESIINAGEARINTILDTAKNEKRSLKEEEYNQITLIQSQMKDIGIRTLSETEEEYKIIQQRMKDNAGIMSARQAAEVVQNSLQQKEQAIQNAEDEYNERIRYAENLKLDGTKESIEMANKIIDEAKRQRDEAVKQAESMHSDVVKEAQNQAKEHSKEVDWETGEIKNKWQVLKSDVVEKARQIATDTGKWFKDTYTKVKGSVSDTAKIVSEKFSDIKKSVGDKLSSAWDSVTGWVEKIKNSFKFTWTLPKFKLPTVSIGSKKGLFGLPIPTFSVSWNRDGGIFKKPTLLPSLQGLQGVGEPSTGGEAIMPLKKLPQLMAEALEKSKSATTQTIINYITLDGKVIAKEVTNNVDNNLQKKSIRLHYQGGF